MKVRMKMTKIKVMAVFGTRPEAVKMAPLIIELKKRPEIDMIVCVTAQHREMLDSVMDVFGIKADYDLDIMEMSQTLSSITTKALLGLEGVIKSARPDIVLVHGDTTTTFAAALAAFYQYTAVGHVEAGLRTYDKYSPYPEEVNRTLIADISDLHFAPISNNAENLRREGVRGEIFVTGNTAIDAIQTTVMDDFSFSTGLLNSLDYLNRRVIAVTCHRRENYGMPMQNIMNALKEIAESFDDVEIVYPVHLSPAVQETAHRVLDGVPRVHLIDPIPADDMHNLMARSYMVMTDSGGLQEEAPSLGKPVLVLRRETERPEAIIAGTVKVAGVEKAEIIRLASELLSDKDVYSSMARAINPYGDGNASMRIADAIMWHFGLTGERPEDFIGQ